MFEDFFSLLLEEDRRASFEEVEGVDGAEDLALGLAPEERSPFEDGLATPRGGLAGFSKASLTVNVCVAMADSSGN